MIYLILRIILIVIGVSFAIVGVMILAGKHNLAFRIRDKEYRYRNPDRYAFRCGILYEVISVIMIAGGIAAFWLVDIFSFAFFIVSALFAVVVIETHHVLSMKNR